MKLTKTREYAILYLSRIEKFSNEDIAARLKIPLSDIERVIAEAVDEELSEPEKPKPKPAAKKTTKASKNTAKMKDLMMTKTQKGNSGVVAMTEEASSYADSMRKNLDNVRATRIQQHIFRMDGTGQNQENESAEE